MLHFAFTYSKFLSWAHLHLLTDILNFMTFVTNKIPFIIEIPKMKLHINDKYKK